MKKLPVKDRLVTTASKLFYEQGYNRTGINEILKESGVAKASMYQHFRSKEEIAIAHLKFMDVNFRSSLTQRAESLPNGLERMMAIFQFVHDFYQKPEYRGCWNLNMISEIPKEDQVILKEIQSQKRSIKAWIEAEVRENLQAKAPTMVANQLYLLFEAAMMESQLFQDEWPIVTAKDLALKLIQANE